MSTPHPTPRSRVKRDIAAVVCLFCGSGAVSGAAFATDMRLGVAVLGVKVLGAGAILARGEVS